MFGAVLHDFHYHGLVQPCDIERGAPRLWRGVLIHDVSTSTWEDSPIHPLAHEWGDRRPLVLEPELEHWPHAVPPCLMHIAPGEQAEAETQTPEAAHVTEFKLAFCMLTHARLGAAVGRVELPDFLVQMIMDAYAPAFAQLFIS